VRQVATSLRCVDGRLLAGQWFEPAAGAGAAVRAIAVIGAATAVPASFYRHFAQWLALRGYAVLTFDYRGIAASSNALLEGEDVCLRDWARLDMGAALHAAHQRRQREAAAQQREVGLLWVGHSLGGNAVTIVPGFAEKVDALLGIAAQVAYWQYWSGYARLQAWAFFHLVLPVSVGLLGRAPGRLLGARAQDLPAGAAREWAAWGRTPGFLYGDESLAREHSAHSFKGAAHLWHVTDDHLFGPASAVDALAAQFRAADVQRHAVSPADLGVHRIEHFGAFRRDLGARLWPQLLGPIEAATPLLAGRFAPAG
jgi:predicted alpha/beta hydrolase